jgi:hypothetical protein
MTNANQRSALVINTGPVIALTAAVSLFLERAPPEELAGRLRISSREHSDRLFGKVNWIDPSSRIKRPLSPSNPLEIFFA